MARQVNSTKSNASSHPLTTRHMSMIGAGAVGLVAARELHHEGHSVIVFERGDQVYTPKVDSSLTQTSVHSSLYQSLRTNLPQECMGFRDYPFVPKDDQGRDPKRFLGHLEVLMYLQDFTREFEIDESVRFEIEVVHVRLEEGKWKIKSRKRGKDDNERVWNWMRYLTPLLSVVTDTTPSLVSPIFLVFLPSIKLSVVLTAQSCVFRLFAPLPLFPMPSSVCCETLFY
ncbi:flavin-containing monooxygenase fmo gs-ox3 [Quercus suber]|uniref:Flavin-containing monooxygenase n=1 Tax=Quercus suber TaxID=58331 RepID=A0AAW0LVD0_QUESU